VRLDVASHPAGVVLELTPRLPEGVAKGDVSILVSSVLVRRAGDHQMITRDADLDAHAEEAPLVLVLVGRFDQHAAADHAIEERLQLIHPAANIVLERWAGRHLVKADL
jgi:hypothetical protein